MSSTGGVCTAEGGSTHLRGLNSSNQQETQARGFYCPNLQSWRVWGDLEYRKRRAEILGRYNHPDSAQLSQKEGFQPWKGKKLILFQYSAFVRPLEAILLSLGGYWSSIHSRFDILSLYI